MITTSECMGYLSFWQALTYRKATPKNTVVKNSIETSCMTNLPSVILGGERWGRYKEFLKKS